jgi:hypothetical protein
MTLCSTCPRFFRRVYRVLVIVALQHVTFNIEGCQLKKAVQNANVRLGSRKIRYVARGRGSFREGFYPKKNEELRSDSGTSVEDYIMNGPRARRDEALVPFVEACYQCRAQHSDVGPAERPTDTIRHRQSLTPRAKQQDAEQAIAEDVSAFADEEVPVLKLLPIQTKEVMQYGIENAAGVVSGQPIGRLDRDHDQPKDQRDPGLQNVVTVGGQRWVDVGRQSLVVCSSPIVANDERLRTNDGISIQWHNSELHA